MGKNVFKRLSIGLLTTALALSLLTGCGEIKAGSTVLRVGDEKISLGLANFFARYMQAQYESYYGISEDAWKQNVSDDETTYEASLKKDIMKNLQNAVLERQNAEEYKISLSDEDKAKIKETAKAFMKDNDAKAEKAVTADQETVENYLELVTYQKRVEDAIRATVTEEDITDKEAAQKKMQYVYIAFSTTDEAGNVTLMEDDQKKEIKKQADAFAKGAAEQEDFAAYATQEGYTATDATFDKNSTDPDAKLIKAADKLKEGEVSDVIEGETGYYVAKLTSTLDREATDQKKQELLSEKQSDAVTKQLKKWKKDTKIKVKKRLWKKVRFDKQGVTIKQQQSEGTEGE